MRLLMLAVALLSGVAHAEQPAGVTEKLVAFVRDTCDLEATDPGMKQRRLAERLGKTLGGDRHRMRVAVRALPGWTALVMQGHLVSMDVPRGTIITVADLERLMGPAKEPQQDFGLLPEGAPPQAPPTSASYDFARFGSDRLCAVSIETDFKGATVQEHHVMQITFGE